MCGVEYLKMGIFHRFAKAVVGTDWLLRRTEAYQKFDGRFGSIGSMLWMVRCCGWFDAVDGSMRMMRLFALGLSSCFRAESKRQEGEA